MDMYSAYGVVAYKRGGGVFGDMNVRGRNAEITTAKQENSKGATDNRRQEGNGG